VPNIKISAQFNFVFRGIVFSVPGIGLGGVGRFDSASLSVDAEVVICEISTRPPPSKLTHGPDKPTPLGGGAQGEGRGGGRLDSGVGYKCLDRRGIQPERPLLFQDLTDIRRPPSPKKIRPWSKTPRFDDPPTPRKFGFPSDSFAP